MSILYTIKPTATWQKETVWLHDAHTTQHQEHMAVAYCTKNPFVPSRSIHLLTSEGEISQSRVERDHACWWHNIAWLQGACPGIQCAATKSQPIRRSQAGHFHLPCFCALPGVICTATSLSAADARTDRQCFPPNKSRMYSPVHTCHHTRCHRSHIVSKIHLTCMPCIDAMSTDIGLSADRYTYNQHTYTHDHNLGKGHPRHQHSCHQGHHCQPHHHHRLHHSLYVWVLVHVHWA